MDPNPWRVGGPPEILFLAYALRWAGSVMKAVVLAAGKGTRLLPLTLLRPKPMIPLLNKPMIDYMLHLLRNAGVTEVIILADYLQEQLVEHIGDGSDFGLKADWTFNCVPYGTAGAVNKVVDRMDETFLVVSADVITGIHLLEFVEFHRKKKAKATIALSQVEDPFQYGIAIKDYSDRITRFLEKPKPEEVFSNLVNAGMYVLEPEVFDYVPSDTDFDFSRNLFPALLKSDEPVYGYSFREYWNDVGRPSSYLECTQHVLEGRVNIPGAMVPSFSLMGAGGVLVTGRNCRIGSGVKLAGFVVLGDDVEVGPNTKLDRVVAWNGVKIGSGCDLAETVIGSAAVLEDNVVLQEGSVVGDGSRLGRSSRIGMNIRLWANSRIGEGTVLM